MDTKRYYSITEVAQLLDVSASAIRFWETEFGSYLNPEKTMRANAYLHPKMWSIFNILNTC
ncbi:MAG: MerR family transcriptional regulator [Sphingobacteriales bacterium]|nr:MerR family transcriptional regulator [Sphingobacteriales bacterium]